METIRIECAHGRRLFDAARGSELTIRMKCGNAKSCALKPTCNRTSEITFGTHEHHHTMKFRPICCPSCSKRLFDASEYSSGFITIKCDTCSKIAVLQILPT